ncbi:MATE family efflux transporter [Clostridium folliculivorans]|uniref:Multidrug export protein MepA n=1 Tax=Clostridium folliculivorans TaxID=2886038 RepID=A0A9W6DBE5_9CLOT|nr:MATE family efflux transporter [Clostridium folliculivorans]GKU25906.1 multidrug transporter MatE [Clostridium folliculivorans]GKU27992.1 multidrug transporter MatE [Clostridium folliculivorans]
MEQVEIEQIDSYYFEKSPIWKAIAHMSLPMMLGMSLNLIYNIIDAYFIGKLNNTEMMSAITLALPFITVLMALGNLFGTGGGTFISRLLGEKNLLESKKVASVSFYFSIITGLILIMFSILMLQPILKLLGAEGNNIEFTKSIILVFTIGSPIIIANFVLEQLVRAEGASTVSMYGMGISVIANIILDPILIFTCHLNIMGAALGTVLGNLCAVFYFIYYIQKKSPALSISFKEFIPTSSMTKDIFKIGVTSLLMDVFLIVSGLLFNNLSIKYGDYVVAGFGISQRVVQLSDFIGMGLFMGVIPLIAYSYSAKNIKRMLEIIRTTAAYIVILIGIISGTLLIFRTQVFQLFSKDSEVLAIGTLIFVAMLLSSLFTSLSGLFVGVFQGVGREKEAAIMSVAKGLIVIPIMILSNVFWGLHGLIWSLTASEILACLVGALLWLHFKKDASMKISV